MLLKHTLLYGQVTMGRSGWWHPYPWPQKGILRRVYLPDPIELDTSHHNSSGLGFKPDHWVRRTSAVTLIRLLQWCLKAYTFCRNQIFTVSLSKILLIYISLSEVLLILHTMGYEKNTKGSSYSYKYFVRWCCVKNIKLRSQMH